jgi:Flp pilus assembly protein TadG
MIKAAHSQRGVALVEIAIMLPFLLLLAIGGIEIGRYANYANIAANAAHAGVQYGAQSLAAASDTAGMQSAAAKDWGTAAGLAATATHYCKCSNGTASTCLSTDCPLPLHRILWVQVIVTGSLNSILSYPAVPRTFNISKTAIMRVDQ